MKAVTIIDPGVAKADDFPLYREGREKGHFLKLPDGREVNAVVWPGLVGFPDFSDPAVRDVVGATSTRPCWTRAWPASGTTCASRPCSPRASTPRFRWPPATTSTGRAATTSRAATSTGWAWLRPATRRCAATVLIVGRGC